MTLQILVNGKARDVPEGTSVSELIGELELRPEQVAVEINRRLIARDRRAEVRLAEGDEVELVTLVGGG
jgi:thiamine biosynthesis protein ThiS